MFFERQSTMPNACKPSHPLLRSVSHSYLLVAHRTDRLALDAPEAEARVIDPPDPDEAPALGRGAPLPEPALELLLGPVAARDEEQAPGPDQPHDPALVPLAYPPPRGVPLLAQADGVKGALVVDDVPAGAGAGGGGARARQDRVVGPLEDVPDGEPDRLIVVGGGGGDLPGQGHALLAVVDAQARAPPALGPQGQEEGAVAAAQVQEGGGFFLEEGWLLWLLC